VLAEVVGFGYPGGRGWSERSAANARLMAVAPEMLLELRLYAIGCSCAQHRDGIRIPQVKNCIRCRPACRVIAKAEGR